MVYKIDKNVKRVILNWLMQKEVNLADLGSVEPIDVGCEEYDNYLNAINKHCEQANFGYLPQNELNEYSFTCEEIKQNRCCYYERNE